MTTETPISPTPLTDEEARIDNGDTKPLLDAMRAMELRLNAVTTERDALLQKHRSVCRACAMLDVNPNATLADFLEKMKTKPQTNDN